MDGGDRHRQWSLSTPEYQMMFIERQSIGWSSMEESGGGGWQGQLMRLHPSGCSAPDLSLSHMVPPGLASTSSSHIHTVLQYYSTLSIYPAWFIWSIISVDIPHSHTPHSQQPAIFRISLFPSLHYKPLQGFLDWLMLRAQWRRILHNFTYSILLLLLSCLSS